MVSWIDVNGEIGQIRGRGPASNYDVYRRGKYSELEQYTGIPLIVYVTDFLTRAKVRACQGEVLIELGDKDPLSEVVRNIESRSVDILLHSPGGDAAATDSLVQMVRSKFRQVRFIIPSVAKSAATMFALSGDRLLMERDAELGPIDPQFTFVRGDGSSVTAPAQAIIDQFEKAQEILRNDRTRFLAWMPILQQYGPALYQQCLDAIELSKKYVKQWTKKWMFKRRTDRENLSKNLVDYLADYNFFKAHSARVGVDELKAKKVRVDVLNRDEELYDRVMRIYYSIICTFQNTGAYKIFENSRGDAWIRQVRPVSVRPMPIPPPGQVGQQPQEVGDQPSRNCS